MWLENSRIRLRALEPEDLQVLYKWENDSSLWQAGNTLSPYSRFILKEYIRNSGSDIYELHQLRLIIEDKASKQAVGTIDLYDFEPHHRRAGVGIIVDPEFQREGFGLEALNLLVEYSFGYLHLHQLFAHIPKANIRSLNLFRKAGFDERAELIDWVLLPGGYSNVYVMQKIKE